MRITIHQKRRPPQRGRVQRYKGKPFLPKLSVVRDNSGGWVFTWRASTPPYQIWLDGFLLATTSGTTYTSTLPGYDTVPPDLEVIDASVVSAQNELYPPYLLFQWRGVQGALGYVVQEYTGGGWVERGTGTELGQGYYSWKTQALDDGANVTHRVMALALNGAPGTPITFSVTVCRNPEHPAVILSIDSSGKLVVSNG